MLQGEFILCSDVVRNLLLVLKVPTYMVIQNGTEIYSNIFETETETNLVSNRSRTITETQNYVWFWIYINQQELQHTQLKYLAIARGTKMTILW